MIEQFLNPNNWLFWLFGLLVGLFYGFFALKMRWLGGNPKNVSLLDRAHQFLVNFPGGAVSGFLLWLLFYLDFIKEPLLSALILLFLYISISGYLPHFIINILFTGKALSDLLTKLLGR
jgi:hypothetical protein